MDGTTRLMYILIISAAKREKGEENFKKGHISGGRVGDGRECLIQEEMGEQTAARFQQ